MKRLTVQPRPSWQKRLEDLGIAYHTLRGEPYWDESVAYQFSTREVDDIELATNTLHAMCLEIVDEVIQDNLFEQLHVPEWFVPTVIKSWERREPSIYGRFDLAYNGAGTPRLLEYNADTPTSLVEAAVAQWFWLKDIDPAGDQFNSIHERLIEAWKNVRAGTSPLYFAAMAGQMEDYVTVEYLRDTAMQGGWPTEYLDVEQIGWDASRKVFVDAQSRPIQRLFKLYPWEWLVNEPFGRNIPLSPMSWFEPPWKMLLSCKAILPLLYDRFPDSPYLLPASFEPEWTSYVKKPILGREGSNVTVVEDGKVTLETEGPYGKGPFVYQQLAPLPVINGHTAVLGSWIIDGVSCGMGVREANSLITQNTSRFVPHIMKDVDLDDRIRRWDDSIRDKYR